jgi:hypothetical protein
METVKCFGYKGHECKKMIRPMQGTRKRCPSCVVGAKREWYKTPKIRKRQYSYARSVKGRIVSRESAWRKKGVLVEGGKPLTVKRFKHDSKNGCMLKKLGHCAGGLVADHDHETGLYRGPLCMHHNHALGKLGDTSRSLRYAADILDKKVQS